MLINRKEHMVLSRRAEASYTGEIFDEIDVANAQSLRHAMLARLAWMRIRELVSKKSDLSKEIIPVSSPKTPQEDWAVKLLKKRESWY